MGFVDSYTVIQTRKITCYTTFASAERLHKFYHHVGKQNINTALDNCIVFMTTIQEYFLVLYLQLRTVKGLNNLSTSLLIFWKKINVSIISFVV